MAKKKKIDTVQDIMDRIQEDIDILRDKAIDLEDNQCECDSSDSDDDFSDDEEEFCTNGIKNNFAIDKFFFNSNGLTCDVTTNIYGPEINYSIVFPTTYSSSSLIGTFTNLNNFAIKIFSAKITNGNSNYYSTSSINNISISANSSGSITLTDLFNETGISQTFTLTLYTNFGIIDTIVNSFRI